jgi:HSP20 family molecular chaperone IbpA
MTTGTTLATHTEKTAPNGRASTIAKRIRDLTPNVDVFENEDEYVLLADMPGATAESVVVQVEGGQIAIEAQRSMPQGESTRYRRQFQLPSTIDQDGISAELRDGVLHVHLKKSEKAKRRVISVRSS